MAGFGAECGSDDEEEETATAQGAGGDLPAVECDGLCGQLGFQVSDLLFCFIERIRAFGEPACVNRGKGQTQENEEDEMFHIELGMNKGGKPR